MVVGDDDEPLPVAEITEPRLRELLDSHEALRAENALLKRSLEMLAAQTKDEDAQ